MIRSWQPATVPDLYMLANADFSRSAGVWSNNQVAIAAQARFIQCRNRNQAISLAHRWCQGYDV